MDPEAQDALKRAKTALIAELEPEVASGALPSDALTFIRTLSFEAGAGVYRMMPESAVLRFFRALERMLDCLPERPHAWSEWESVVKKLLDAGAALRLEALQRGREKDH